MATMGMTRAIRRLARAHNSRTCSVLNLAPTGAAALAMGMDGCTIDSTCWTVLPHGNARKRSSATAFDNPLTDAKRKKLRELVGGGPWPYTLRLLNLDEQSMMNLTHFVSTLQRLSEARGENLQDQLNKGNNGKPIGGASIVIAGDPGQLPTVAAKPLDTPLRFAQTNIEKTGALLFQTFVTQAIVLDKQMRLRVQDEADAKLARLQKHAYNGTLDNDDRIFISSRVYASQPEEERARLDGLRTLRVWARNAHVRMSNSDAVAAASQRSGVPVADVLAVDRGTKCAKGDNDLGQMPGRTPLVPGLPIVVTANGGGRTDLTRPLCVANGSRGCVVATLFAPGVRPPALPCAVVLDLPGRANAPPLAAGWPPTWMVIAPESKNCTKNCCTRTGLALQPSENVTVYKCQGITCGEHDQCQRVHVTFSDSNDPEKMRMSRAFFVAITRVRRARDLTFEQAVTMEFLQRINEASWRPAFDIETARVREMHETTLMRVREHTTDEGWIALLRRLDVAANDGVHDAECSTPEEERARCRDEGCACCRLAQR